MSGMVRYNLLAVVGAAISVGSIPIAFLWIVGSMGWSSADTPLDRQLSSLTVFLGSFYILGAAISILTPLGGLLGLPSSCIILLVNSWYYSGGEIRGLTGGDSLAALGLTMVPLVGSSIVAVSLFVQVTRKRRELRGPFGRFRTWTGGVGHSETPGYAVRIVNLPARRRDAAAVLSSMRAAFLVAAAAMLSANVASVDVHVLFDPGYYGPDIKAAVYIDGKIAEQSEFHSYSHPIEWHAIHGISAGSHTIGLDFANGTSSNLDGIIDIHQEIKVLPFTTEYRHFYMNVFYA